MHFLPLFSDSLFLSLETLSSKRRSRLEVDEDEEDDDEMDEDDMDVDEIVVTTELTWVFDDAFLELDDDEDDA